MMTIKLSHTKSIELPTEIEHYSRPMTFGSLTLEWPSRLRLSQSLSVLLCLGMMLAGDAQTWAGSVPPHDYEDDKLSAAARREIVETISDYSESHPEIHYLPEGCAGRAFEIGLLFQELSRKHRLEIVQVGIHAKDEQVLLRGLWTDHTAVAYRHTDPQTDPSSLWVIDPSLSPVPLALAHWQERSAGGADFTSNVAPFRIPDEDEFEREKAERLAEVHGEYRCFGNYLRQLGVRSCYSHLDENDWQTLRGCEEPLGRSCNRCVADARRLRGQEFSELDGGCDEWRLENSPTWVRESRAQTVQAGLCLDSTERRIRFGAGGPLRVDVIIGCSESRTAPKVRALIRSGDNTRSIRLGHPLSSVASNPLHAKSYSYFAGDEFVIFDLPASSVLDPSYLSIRVRLWGLDQVLVERDRSHL